MDQRRQSKWSKGLWISVSQILRQRKLEFFQPLLLDVGFFFVVGMVVGAIGERLLDVLYALGAIVIRSSASAVEARDLYGALSPQAQALGWQGAFLLVAVLMAVYAIYVCLHGMLWALISSWVAPVDKRLYLKRFAQVNVVWGIVALLILAWALWMELMSKIGEIAPEWPWWLALGILMCLSAISYALLGEYTALRALARCCRLALRPQFMGSVICAGLIIFAIDALIASLGSSALSLIVGAVAVFGLAVVLRLICCVLVEVHHAR